MWNKAGGRVVPEQLVQVGINPREVFPGSVAMQGFTWRFSGNVA